MSLYTKNGKFLQVVGDTIYSRSGVVVGKMKGDKVFDKGGRYLATIVNDRLVYRATDKASVSRPFTAPNRPAVAKPHKLAVAILGDEPKIPD